MDALELRANQAGFDMVALDKTPERCVHCGRDVLFVDETECWFSRDTGYDCTGAPVSLYGSKSHDV